LTGSNKVFLVLGRRTGAHHEDCEQSDILTDHYSVNCIEIFVIIKLFPDSLPPPFFSFYS